MESVCGAVGTYKYDNKTFCRHGNTHGIHNVTQHSEGRVAWSINNTGNDESGDFTEALLFR